MNNSFLDFQLFAFPDGTDAAKNWQGSTQSGILILHNDTEGLSDEDRGFLANILKAVKLEPIEEKVALASCGAQSTIPLAQITRNNNIHTVILFGTPLQSAGLQAQLPYYEFSRLGELSLLRAHSLRQIREERQANKNEKAGLLWNALKAKFL